MRKFWTDAEDRWLIENYPDTLAEDIAKHLGRTVRSVYARANGMGLKKSAEFLSCEAAFAAMCWLSNTPSACHFITWHSSCSNSSKSFGDAL